MGKKKIVLSDNIMMLLRELVLTDRIDVSYRQLISDVKKYFKEEADYIDTLIKVLKKWGINASLKKTTFEELDGIATPSLVFLVTRMLENGNTEVKLNTLISKENDTLTLFDPERGYYEFSRDELEGFWINTVIELKIDDTQNATQSIPAKHVPHEKPGISVIMPIYNQTDFVVAALNSLQSQTYENWELIIVNDGSTDKLKQIIEPFQKDKRIRYYENKKNEGLGYSLNKGIKHATFDLIAYLPADDIFYDDHLETLADALLYTNSLMAYAAKDDQNYIPDGKYKKKVDLKNLQLVQVLHRKKRWKWMERKELVTDDLHRMYWHYFDKHKSKIVGTYHLSCEWTEQHMQRSRIIKEQDGGGIYLYKSYYNVTEPIKYQSTIGNYIDEIEWFADFRNKSYPKDEKPLKILIVGEIAYNPERIVAFEEKGHKLYGLWMNYPNNICTIGPLPYGNVTDIDNKNWRQAIKEIKPDIIYAMLNMWSINIAYEVLKANLGIPFVWHFKEGPMFCLENGLWNKLLYLYANATGRIYNNELYKKWFEMYLPEHVKHEKYFILDGDLPKKERFYDKRSPLLSDSDGEIHTVCPGRPVGITAKCIEEMAAQKIHIHIYGEVHQERYKKMIGKASRVGKYLHLHPNCPQSNWVEEFSQYDAGWMHCFRSENYGDIKKVTWNDMNSPARMSTYAMAGIPMLMFNNKGHRNASYELLVEKNMALTFDFFKRLHESFDDKEKLEQIRKDTWERRFEFSFDYYVDDLLSFFRSMIQPAG